jgi:hypothetical protein
MAWKRRRAELEALVVWIERAVSTYAIVGSAEDGGVERVRSVGAPIPVASGVSLGTAVVSGTAWERHIRSVKRNAREAYG